MGLKTLFGRDPGGFFIPYRQAATVQPIRYPALEILFSAARPEFEAIIDAIETFEPDLTGLQGAGSESPKSARFDQDWFSTVDACAAYALVRRYAPQKIIEIGSGHSTRFLSQAVIDGAFGTEIVCVDPQPRASLATLPVFHDSRLFADAHAEAAARLGKGDILFVDSSHIGQPGTDVDRIVLDVLPRLRSGVLLHVHDIFLPDAYPADWAWRGYNEHLAVGALLQGGAWSLLWSSHYVSTRIERFHRSLLSRMPQPRTARPASIWLRKS